MSELPNLSGQTFSTLGGVSLAFPSWRAWRYASIAGQSAARRVSFHTAPPYVLVAVAYT